MHTYEIEAAIDLNNYKPDLPHTVDNLDENSLLPWRVYNGEMKKLAVRLARYGDKEGMRYRGTRIINVIRDKFPSYIEKLPSRTAVENWIADVDYVGDEVAYSPDSVPRQWRSYVARLSMISEFWHQRPLTGNEASEAQYVGNEFQDPFGEEVDLFPQLAMVREITKYAQLKSPMLKIFEDYFTFAPWKFGRDLIDSSKGFSFPAPTDFMMYLNAVENWKDVSPIFEDALIQLGLPYTALYFPFGQDSHVRLTEADYAPMRPHYGNAAKGACKWQNILKSRTPEDQAKLMEPLTFLDLDERRLLELSESSTALTPDGLVTGDLRPWMKKDRWIRIERVPCKEDNDD
jgi:hypothetical protein